MTEDEEFSPNKELAKFRRQIRSRTLAQRIKWIKLGNINEKN